MVKDHNIEQGVMAAAWLGQMQGYFVQHAEHLTRCDFLIHHDANFFRSKAEQALGDVSQISTPSAHRLARIVDRYEPVIKVMVTQPLTLVHGAYIPWHILVDPQYEPVRVCIIDWELAAVGATLFDLAIFTDGVELPAREQIWDAYRQAAMRYNVPVPDRAQICYIVDCFRLHRIFDWLSRSVEKQFSENKVRKLVDQAEQQSASVLV